MAEIELAQEYAIVVLPRNSIEVEIQAKIYQDGKIVTVANTMTMDDIRKAFKEAAEGYMPEDATFQITEKGLKYLEGLDGADRWEDLHG